MAREEVIYDHADGHPGEEIALEGGSYKLGGTLGDGYRICINNRAMITYFNLNGEDALVNLQDWLDASTTRSIDDLLDYIKSNKDILVSEIPEGSVDSYDCYEA